MPDPQQPDDVDPMAPGKSVNDDDSDTDAVEPNEPA
jgi:hypothetical protein